MPTVRGAGQHAWRPCPDRQAGRGRRGRNKGVRRERAHPDRRDKSNGVKDVLRLHTKAGYTLDVTADHLVWRSSSEAPAVRPAGDIPPGDMLEWHRRDSYGEADFPSASRRGGAGGLAAVATVSSVSTRRAPTGR